MNEKIVSPPKWWPLIKSDQAFKWFSRLVDLIQKVETYQVSINPDSVAANNEGVTTVTVTGLTTEDIVTVIKPTNTAGLDLVQAWVQPTGTLNLKFRNHTGSAIDAGEETYLIQANRR